MSALLCCLLAFGRLSGDTEIVAMKAGGISLYRIALPGLLLMATLSAVDIYLSDRIVPNANYESGIVLMQSLLKQTDENIIKKMTIDDIAPDGTYRQIMARAFNPERGLIEGLTIVFYRDTLRSRQMWADSASYSNGVWQMYKVRSQDLDDAGNVISTSYSDVMTLPLGSPDKLNERPRNRTECNRRMLLKKMRIEMNTHGGQVTRKAREYLVEYYARIALPMSCLVFGLFGIPLGLQPHRSSKSIGIGLCLGFIILYYLLGTFSRAMGEGGHLPPLVAAWLPNGIFGGVGLGLLIKAGRV